jgi:hypothetical protein
LGFQLQLKVRFTLPGVISDSARIWSIIEIGNLDELSGMLFNGEISPHAVSNCGVSLLKVGLPPALGHTAIDINLQHAASQGQNEIYAFLLAQGADPYLYDHVGMYGNSSSIVLPGIC